MAVKFEGKPVEEIIQSLRADEWIANYQYHIGKEISKGKAKNFLDKVFDKNGDEEYDDHFKQLSDWLQAMGVPLVTDFCELNEIANTPFVEVSDPTSTKRLLEIAIKGEDEAVEAYRAALAEKSVTECPELVWMLSEFIKDELVHKKDLMDVQSQIDGGAEDGDMDDNDDEEKRAGSSRFFSREELEARAGKLDDEDKEQDDDFSDDTSGSDDDDGGDDNEDNDEETPSDDDDESNDDEDEGQKAEESVRDDANPNKQFIPLENKIGEDTEKVKSHKQVEENDGKQVIVEKKSHKKMGVLEKIMLKGMK